MTSTAARQTPLSKRMKRQESATKRTKRFCPQEKDQSPPNYKRQESATIKDQSPQEMTRVKDKTILPTRKGPESTKL